MQKTRMTNIMNVKSITATIYMKNNKWIKLCDFDLWPNIAASVMFILHPIYFLAFFLLFQLFYMYFDTPAYVCIH